MRQLEELDPEQAQAAFVPRDYQAMRRVPGYDRFVKERFERCLDLYLCPRAEKVKLNIDPESLVPRLPLPKELRPFPTSTGVIYLGHTGRVRAVSFDPSGQLLATAGDDGDVRVWDVESGRCVLRRAVVEAGNDEGVTRVAWNPCKPGLLAVASGGKVFVMFLGYSTSAFDEGVLGPSVTLLAGSTPGASSTEPDKHVEWMEQGPVGDIGALSAGEPAAVVMAIKGAHLVSDICWHCKGEFLATVSSTPAKGGRVLVHHVGRRQSEDPVGPKQKGDAQCVCFHPTKPVLFMATKTHLLVFHLVRRVLLKKMSAGVKWISSIAVHPKGDHVVLGSFDCRVAWFDLDLGSKPFRVLKYHTKAVRRVAFHKRYPLLASSSDDGRINVFHATVYEDLMRNPLLVPVKKIEAHDVVEGRGCLDLAFHPTLPWVVSCGADGTAVLWTNVP
jgi:ribosome biogenesis protein ERB1